MQKQIASFLFQTKTCPLPGLGTLWMPGTGAEADFTNKMIGTPKASIQFTHTETDNTGFLNYLAATSGADKNEVRNTLVHFCDNLKKQIMEQSNVKLDSIGNFFIDASGTILFKQEELPAAFVQPVFAERVIHPNEEHQILVGDRETTNTVMTEWLAPKTENKDRWWIWAIVLAAVGLLLLVIYFTELDGAPAFGNTIKI